MEKINIEELKKALSRIQLTDEQLGHVTGGDAVASHSSETEATFQLMKGFGVDTIIGFATQLYNDDKEAYRTFFGNDSLKDVRDFLHYCEEKNLFGN